MARKDKQRQQLADGVTIEKVLDTGDALHELREWLMAFPQYKTDAQLQNRVNALHNALVLLRRTIEVSLDYYEQQPVTNLAKAKGH
jgi:tRNA U34 5-carboxymethylaminomethyl modifying GTPase MnmE/TrmE